MKFKSKIFFISLILLVLLGISAASASEEDVVLANDTVEVLTSTDDVEVQTEESNDEQLANSEEDVLSSTGSFAELTDAIQDSSWGTLELNKSYENKGNEEVIYLELDITIDGKGHTIDANGKSSIFSIYGDDIHHVILKNIIFKNARGSSGGAIYTETEENIACRIQNCTFIQNQAENGGAAVCFSTEGELEIQNSIFRNNYALYARTHKTHGGAIFIDEGQLLVEESLFEDNDARGYGGAIYSTVKAEIILCNFNRNYAVNRGGSVFLSNSGSYITDSNFTSSSCEGDGGAVYSERDMLLINSNFIDCYAEDNGGAIYAKGELKIGEHPSRFINNRVSVDNVVYANKGGAIFAGKFNSEVNGLVFINNKAWYGGAIYINNENDVIFKSCYFEDNVAKNAEGTSGYGAAIYVDSSNSHISLFNNIFINNEAIDDKAVYICGKYSDIGNNWWGTNIPNFNDPYLIEWHRVGSDEKHSDKSPLKLVIVADKSEATRLENVALNIKFIDSEGSDLTSDMRGFDVVFSSDKKANITSTGSKSNVIYTPLESGVHTITAKLSNFDDKTSINVMGDFDVLQSLVNNAQDVLNLERDYVYSSGIDTITEGILINKPLTINGNGHTIDANGKSRIFKVVSNGVTINNVVLKNGNAPDTGSVYESTNDGSAILINDVRNTIVSNSKFINNYAGEHGGAIYSTEDGDNTQILNCYFESNTANNWGGAISISTPNSKIQDCTFVNNTAESGGALNVEREASNVVVNNSRFMNNSAVSGGAIEFYAPDCRVENSVFISNRASVKEITPTADGNLTLTLTGKENYINAIYSDKDLKISNVTYWNGTIVTGDNPIRSDIISGINVTIEVRDSENRLVKNIVLKTDVNGQVKYDYSELESGEYTFKAYNVENEYYAGLSTEGNFEVIHIAPNPSSVTIITPDEKEFTYGYVNIEFICQNKTEIRILVTDLDGSEIFYDYLTGFNNFNNPLPASDEYYNITVFNIGNKTFRPSKDSILFKVNKINSTIEIDYASLLPDILYNSTKSIDFTGDSDCHDYNVTIYDENNVCVYNTTVFVSNAYGHVELPLLDVGNYNITITNLGNVNKNPKSQTARFKVVKPGNNFNVTVDDNVYGKDIPVTVRADVDGEYLVKINSTTVTVNVVEGVGSEIVELGAGYYTANVTFTNDNYNNNATNDTFTIQKAQSHVGIDEFGDVVLNQSRTIRFTDFYITKFNVTIYDEGNVVVSSENTTSLLYQLPKLSEDGTYNLIVTNLGNENVLGSQASYVFNVVSNNNVEVLVDDADYGREILIVVTADVDGLYTVDVNGTEVVVEVVEGIGFDDTLQLPAGDYYANVTFDNPHYTNNITNATFTIFQAQSNLEIYEVGNVTYGADVVVRFYDDYPTTFSINVIYLNGTVVMNATFEYDDKDPEMSVIFSGLDVGEYRVNITNFGDENVIGSEDTIGFNVTELPGTIIASNMARGYNSGMDFNVTLVDKNGTGIANTIVTFVINGKEYNAVTDANGVAVINAKLAVGTYTVDVINPYNDVLTTSTLKIVTRITGNKNVNTNYGKNYPYKLRIIGDDGNPVGAGVEVKVTINGKAQTLKTDKNGYITVKFTKSYLPKTYKVTAEYKGVKVSNNIKVKKVLKLKKVKVKRSAKKLKLKATLKEGKKALKGKKVVFKFKGKKYTAKTNKKGVAKVTIKKKVLKKLKKGKKVKYQVTYLKNTVKRTAKVKG